MTKEEILKHVGGELSESLNPDELMEWLSSGLDQLEQEHKASLKYELHNLDWIKILAKAIASRPTSWNQDPVWEWRNASDEVLFAVIHALEEKGILETRLEQIKRFEKEIASAKEESKVTNR